MWLKICILALCAVYSAQTVQIQPFRSVFTQAEGSTLQVNCTSQNSEAWVADPPGAMPTDAVRAQADSGDNISTLMLENIQKSNEGTFRCKDKTTGDEVSFELKVFSVMTQNATFEYKVDAMLHCGVTGDSNVYKYTWRKGSTPVADIVVEEKQAYIQHENGSLEIVNPSRSFAGLYTCMAVFEDSTGTIRTIDIDVPYRATPKVLPFDKSKNLVQDENLVVECKVLGYPKPYITWLKGNQEIKVDSGSRYKLLAANTYDGMSIDNARLEIDMVDFDDAAEYKCMARSGQWPSFNSSQIILVRVKDKLAALWPFLGIVAEVVILCTIIFIYEKKRNKDAMLDEDDDQDGAAPEKKSENVRHRGNTNNPRA